MLGNPTPDDTIWLRIPGAYCPLHGGRRIDRLPIAFDRRMTSEEQAEVEAHLRRERPARRRLRFPRLRRPPTGGAPPPAFIGAGLAD